MNIDIKHYQKLLDSEKEKLTKEINYYNSEDPYLDKYRQSETFDNAITEIEGHDRLASTKADLESFLVDVESALKRIESGKFGICENCGDKISQERLDILPTAKLCQSCQKQKNGR